VARADRVAAAALQGCNLQKWISGIDSDTGDILFFFPIDFLDNFTDKIRNQRLEVLRKYWYYSRFEVLEEREMYFSEYKAVPFCSIFFRLKDNLSL